MARDVAVLTGRRQGERSYRRLLCGTMSMRNLAQVEFDAHSHPDLDGSSSFFRGIESPLPDGFDRTFVQSHPETANNLDAVRRTVLPDPEFQLDGSFQSGIHRLIRVLGRNEVQDPRRGEFIPVQDCGLGGPFGRPGVPARFLVARGPVAVPAPLSYRGRTHGNL